MPLFLAAEFIGSGFEICFGFDRRGGPQNHGDINGGGFSAGRRRDCIKDDDCHKGVGPYE